MTTAPKLTAKAKTAKPSAPQTSAQNLDAYAEGRARTCT
jgi:hypothetical protein